MQPTSLPAKFDRYIINNPANQNLKDLKTSLDAIFNSLDILSPTSPFQILDGKNHIVQHPDLPSWIIKGNRTEVGGIAPDQHIYRVRKALKLQKVIDTHGFTEFVVPKKYLYKHGDQWFVIAEKLELVDIPQIAPLTLTPKQAKEGATLIYEGKLEDIHERNLLRTKNKKFALIDTEPTSRGPVKELKRNLFVKLIPYFMERIKFLKPLISSERLLLVSREQNNSHDEIRKIQTRYFLLHLAKQTAMTVLPLFASLGVLFLAVQTTNPLLIKLGLTATVLSGINAIVGTSFILNAIYSLRYYRSIAGHSELNMN